MYISVLDIVLINCEFIILKIYLYFFHERSEWPYINPHSFSSWTLMVSIRIYLFLRSGGWEIFPRQFSRKFSHQFSHQFSDGLHSYLFISPLGSVGKFSAPVLAQIFAPISRTPMPYVTFEWPKSLNTYFPIYNYVHQ